jgi:hypothetical protein
MVDIHMLYRVVMYHRWHLGYIRNTGTVPYMTVLWYGHPLDLSACNTYITKY